MWEGGTVQAVPMSALGAQVPLSPLRSAMRICNFPEIPTMCVGLM